MSLSVILLNSAAVQAQEVEEMPQRTPAEATQLDDWALQRARAWVKLYGYVRWFHPSDQASAVDMDAWACHGMSRIQSVQDPAALRDMLAGLLAPVAPSAQIWLDGDPVPSAVATGEEVTAWQHYGWGQGSISSPYRSVRHGRTLEIPGYTPRGYGAFQRRLEAAPFRGRTLRLRASLRASHGGRANLWIQTEAPSGGALDSTCEDPVGAAEWTARSVEVTVAGDAHAVVLGGYLQEAGEAWFDGVELEIRRGDSWTRVALENGDFERRLRGWELDTEGYRYAAERSPTGGRALRIRNTTVTQSPSFESLPAPGRDRYSLGAGLSARVPLAVTDGPDGTLPAPAIELPTLPGCGESDALEVRLASVAIAWNVFQHFYPYFDVVEVDWEAVLDRALSATLAGEPLERTLQRLVAALADGHGLVSAVESDRGRLPIALGWVEAQLVVLSSGVEGVGRGDLVTAIDGRQVAEVWAELSALRSGSTQWKDAIASETLVWGTTGDTRTLTLDGGSSVSLSFGAEAPPPTYERAPIEIERLEDGVFYVDLNSVPWSEIEPRLPEIAAAPGVVFDLRAYPKPGNHAVLAHLLTEEDGTDWMFIPEIVYPDHHSPVAWRGFGWNTKPATPHIGGEVAFLTSGRAISYAEAVLGCVAGHGLAELVGGASAGANGNINPFKVPGGYRINWTGMRVLKHDGGQHHLIGVLPTVPAAPTLEGIRAGRDEVLERGLEVVRRPAGLSKS